MSESLISNRVVFTNKKEQATFITRAKNAIGLNWQSLAVLLAVHPRTLYDWKIEKTKISQAALQFLSTKSGIPIPKHIKILEWKNHASQAGKIGGRSHFKKYGSVGGNDEYRRTQWEKWWEKEGQYKKFKIFNRKKISAPKKSEDLAEFVGIMMGDGSLTKYHASITLDAKTDRKYSFFVSKLIYKLFGFKPKKYRKKTRRAVDIVMHGINLVNFFQSIGLPLGDKIKHGLDIPTWIRINKKFSIACIRGLIDTDGCFFNHSYNSNEKRYSYLKIAFTNRSKPLIQSVKNILISFGFCVRITKDGYDVRLENQDNVRKYIKIIGTSNPKHWSKLKHKYKLQGRMSERPIEHLC